MSLESALAENTAAHLKSEATLAKHCGLLEQVIAGQSKALEAIGNVEGGKAISGRPRAVKAKDTPVATTGAPTNSVPVVEPTTVAAKAEAPKPEAKPAAKSDVLTDAQQAEIRKILGDWFSATNDLEERGKRHAVVRAIFTTHGVQKAPEISPADYDTVVAEINAAIAEYESASGAVEEDTLLG